MYDVFIQSFDVFNNYNLFSFDFICIILYSITHNSFVLFLTKPGKCNYIITLNKL